MYAIRSYYVKCARNESRAFARLSSFAHSHREFVIYLEVTLAAVHGRDDRVELGQGVGLLEDVAADADAGRAGVQGP